MPEPEVLLPEELPPELVPVLESGVAALDEPGPANGVAPEASLPEALDVPLAPEVPLEPELPLEPEVLPAESVPIVGELDPEAFPLLEPVELLEPEAPDEPAESVPIVGELDPEELPPIPEEPDVPDEPLLEDSFTVVVVVVVVVPEPPDEPLEELLGNAVEAASFEGSFVVVVVVC